MSEGYVWRDPDRQTDIVHEVLRQLPLHCPYCSCCAEALCKQAKDQETTCDEVTGPILKVLVEQCPCTHPEFRYR